MQMGDEWSRPFIATIALRLHVLQWENVTEIFLFLTAVLSFCAPPHPNPPPRPSRDGGLTCAPPRGLFGLGGQCGHIEDVVTDVGARGGGLGRRIVEHLTGLARARGCYKVILDCAEDNAGFYAKCGFRRKEVQMVQYFEQESSGGSSRGV